MYISEIKESQWAKKFPTTGQKIAGMCHGMDEYWKNVDLCDHLKVHLHTYLDARTTFIIEILWLNVFVKDSGCRRKEKPIYRVIVVDFIWRVQLW